MVDEARGATVSQAEYLTDWRSRNPGKQAEYSRNHELRHPGAHHSAQLKHRYKIDGLAAYEVMLAAQNGVCAICKSPDPGRNRKYFCVDHDHACCPGRFSCGKCVRGLLCVSCNDVLGKFKDDPELFAEATRYLEAWAQ